MIRYRVVHITTYTYTEAVSLCHNIAHLVPRECPWQECERTDLRISPNPAVLDHRIDFFGNPTTHFTVQEPHKQLTVTADHTIGVRPRHTPDPLGTHSWEHVLDRLSKDRSRHWVDARPFVCDSRYIPIGPAFAEYADVSFRPNRPILAAAAELTQRIFKDFRYDPRATTVATPVAEVLSNRRGVCQDFAHFQIACLRSLGLAARYVSGYLSTVPPPGKERMIGADASHAWVSLFCGDAGWVDLDPTNDQLAADRHIQLAWGRDYDDVSPVKGVILGGGQHAVEVSVDAAIRPD